MGGLRLILRAHFRRVDGRAKDMRLVFGIGDPTCLRSVEDGISPCLEVEREAVYIDVAGPGLEAPVMVLVEVHEVQEDDDLGRGYEWTVELDAHGRGIVWIDHKIAHVFAGEVLHISR